MKIIVGGKAACIPLSLRSAKLQLPVYVNFSRAEGRQRHKSWRKRGFATETKGGRERGKKRGAGVAERKSVGNYNIHFDKRETAARSCTLLSVSGGNLLSRCPENYPAFAPRTLSLRTACPAVINTPMITGAKHANDYAQLRLDITDN